MSAAPYADRYELLDVLGQGATGRVHRARDLKMHRMVALKVIQPGKVSRHTLTRLGREARIAAQLQHDHVARVFDFGAHGTTWFIVQELVEGDSLEDLIHRRGRLRIPDALALTADLARGLQAIHELGVMHRDLKPDNVIVTEAGHAKLVDFGVAREVESQDEMRLTKEGSWVGSPLYVAPEAVVGEATPASDVFGLGAILFYALTGAPPHEEASGSVVELVSARLDGPPSARALREDVSPQLDALLARMLAPRGEDRPALPELLRALLELKTSGQGTNQPRLVDKQVVVLGSAFASALLLLVVLTVALGGAAEVADAPVQPEVAVAEREAPKAASAETVETAEPETSARPTPLATPERAEAAGDAETESAVVDLTPIASEETEAGFVEMPPLVENFESGENPGSSHEPDVAEGAESAKGPSTGTPPVDAVQAPPADSDPAKPVLTAPAEPPPTVAKPEVSEPEVPKLSLASVFNGRALSDGDQVELRYGFKDKQEAKDFEVALPAKIDKRRKIVQGYLDGLRPMGARRFRGVDPWIPHRGQLFVTGWSRRRLVAPFRADAPLTVELEAYGNRNIALALVNKGKTFLIVLGYEMPVLPVATAPASLATAWRTQITKLGQIARQRGPALAVLRETDVFLHEELFVQPLKPRKSKNTLAFTLEPGEKQGTLTFSLGRKKVPVAVPIFEGRVDLWLLALGRPLGVDELYVAGRLYGGFHSRAKKALAEAKELADLAAWRREDFAARKLAAEEALKPKAPVGPAVGR